MERIFKIWILILITVSLLYLAFTNRYNFILDGRAKYDTWFGKTKSTEIMDESLSPKQYAELKILNTIDSLKQENNLLRWELNEQPKYDKIIDSLTHENNLLKEKLKERAIQTLLDLEETIQKDTK